MQRDLSIVEPSVCLFVRPYVCRSIAIKMLCMYIFYTCGISPDYLSSSRMKVIGSRSRFYKTLSSDVCTQRGCFEYDNRAMKVASFLRNRK